MTKEAEQNKSDTTGTRQNLSDFTRSYESFNRIVNSLQRQYIELKEEFSAQNEQLIETNRKLMELSSRHLQATEFLNSILTSLAAGVIAVESNGRITHFNPAASMMLGIPVDEPPGKPYRDIIPPGDPVHANALRAVETGVASTATEKRIDLADGTRLFLSVSTTILRNDEGQPLGAVEVFHDLTRIKKMEAEIARLNTLAALGEMAATIAHQVRNPLAGIGGFASLLKRDLESDDPRRKVVDKIIRGVESLNATVTSLLDYSRSETINPEIVNYPEFLAATIEQYRLEHHELLADMAIRFVSPEKPGDDAFLIRLDPQLFQQLLGNFLTNAVEACDGRGTVTVSCRKLPRQSACRCYNERLLIGLDETVVETVVADDGCGIKPDVLDKVFSPFFTTRQGGNGLGLAVAWKIVKAHSGNILVRNGKDKGARFTILLPTKVHPLAAELPQEAPTMERG